MEEVPHTQWRRYQDQVLSMIELYSRLGNNKVMSITNTLAPNLVPNLGTRDLNAEEGPVLDLGFKPSYNPGPGPGV